MNRSEIKICVLRIEGTNNEDEMYYAFKRLGASPELVHLKDLKDI
ncbi:MAG: phosphoribosylformylglycinamidine synthase subunit PurQ, partial [Candidatus Methanofastidiosa archaeon]|nr:phosphoribosylformylglycinamidine synthase subunit PurQ [Candidatus Methanofastidiosa archaeon]